MPAGTTPNSPVGFPSASFSAATRVALSDGAPDFRYGGTLVEPRRDEPNGEDFDNFDDVVAVGSPVRFDCSGVLVHPLWVLTARHCGRPSRVMVGTMTGTPKRTIGVVQVVDHPGALDVALLRLGEAAGGVPVRARRRADDATPPAGVVRLVGFGEERGIGERPYGRKRRLDVVASGWGCDMSNAHAVGCLAGSELVLPGAPGADTCDGDSGGAALEMADGRYRLVGITSRPRADAATRCGAGGVYTRADGVDGWLRGVIGEGE